MSRKYIIGILVIVAVFGVLLYRYNSKSEYNIEATASPSASVSSRASGTNLKGVGTGTSLSYSQAVAKYTTSRIQFDAYCQTAPKSAVFKNNTSIMLDNRSGDARTISLDSRSYNLTGYGFAVVTLYSSKLPHSVVVNCGSAKNVMQLTIEK